MRNAFTLRLAAPAGFILSWYGFIIEIRERLQEILLQVFYRLPNLIIPAEL